MKFRKFLATLKSDVSIIADFSSCYSGIYSRFICHFLTIVYHIRLLLSTKNCSVTEVSPGYRTVFRILTLFHSRFIRNIRFCRFLQIRILR